MTNDSFQNYTSPDAAQNEFNYQYDKLSKQLGSAKGGKVQAYAKGGIVKGSYLDNDPLEPALY